MVVPCQARQLSLPQSSSSSFSSPEITYILFDTATSSLSLTHSDSSISLYPSFSPLSHSSLSFPQTFISSPTSSAAFLPIQTPNRRRLLFLVAAPTSSGAVILRFWILRNSNCFVRAQVICNHRGINYDASKSGVVFDVSHGVSVKLAASVNVFVMYSVSNRKVWVFAVKMVEEEDDDYSVKVKLMKTAVIDCSLPVFTVNVSFGFLILGELDGVRVFRLQPLVKGKIAKKNNSRSRLVNLPNGKIQVSTGGDECYSDASSIRRNANSDGYIDKHSASTKLKSAKVRQDSKESDSSFVSFKGHSDRFKPTELQMKSAKAITVEALSPNEFLIMDSVGCIHHLRLSNPVFGSEISCRMKQLSLSIEVQKMAVLPDLSSRAQTFWISDGHYTVHTILLSDTDTSIIGSERKDNDEKLIQISVTSAIFSGEKIQQLVPSAANAMLILGQGSMYAFAIS